MATQQDDVVGQMMSAMVQAGQEAASLWLRALTDLAEAANTLSRAAPFAPRHAGCCDIPRACWLPRELPDVRTLACPGSRASLRISVTNCTAAPRRVTVRFAAKPPGALVTPETVDIRPMERAVFTATVSVPSDATSNGDIESLLWVHGCQTHVVRWTVGIAEVVVCRSQEIAVEDCSDPVHHWYDHFYCQRPCAGSEGVAPAPVVGRPSRRTATPR